MGERARDGAEGARDAAAEAVNRAGRPAGAPPTPHSPSSPPAPDRESAQREQSKAEDLALIERARRGDTSGFAVLFEKYCEKLYRIVYGYVHDKDDALDIAQEAFIKAFKNLDAFEGKSSFYTWLTQIGINLSIDARRRKARRKVVALEDYMDPSEKIGGSTPPPPPDRGVAEEELRERYLAALEQLSEKHRTVFLLHTVEGMAYKEIAESLEVSIGTVMSRLHYARKKLQELLAEYLK